MLPAKIIIYLCCHWSRKNIIAELNLEVLKRTTERTEFCPAKKGLICEKTNRAETLLRNCEMPGSTVWDLVICYSLQRMPTAIKSKHFNGKGETAEPHVRLVCLGFFKGEGNRNKW